MIELTEDEFIAWRHSPVSKMFFDTVALHLDEIKKKWLDETWGTGRCSQERLAELKGRHKGLEEFISLNFADLVITLEEHKNRNG